MRLAMVWKGWREGPNGAEALERQAVNAALPNGVEARLRTALSVCVARISGVISSERFGMFPTRAAAESLESRL